MVDALLSRLAAGGCTLGAIALLSLWMWFVGLRLLMTLRRQSREGLEARLREDAAALRARGWRGADLTRRLERTARALTAPLRRELPRVAVLASCAPLLGLLGTVAGMIASFQVITALGCPDPRSLAAGISHALVTTEAGLLVALPGLLLHGRLRSRLEALEVAARARARRLAAEGGR